MAKVILHLYQCQIRTWFMKGFCKNIEFGPFNSLLKSLSPALTGLGAK